MTGDVARWCGHGQVQARGRWRVFSRDGGCRIAVDGGGSLTEVGGRVNAW